MIWDLAAITLGGVVRALAPSEAVFLAGSVVLGLATGTLQLGLPRVASDTLPDRTNLVSAIYFYGLVMGGAGGVALTPLLIALVGGWRGILLVWALFGAIAAAGWLALPTARQTAMLRGRLRLSDATQALRLPGWPP